MLSLTVKCGFDASFVSGSSEESHVKYLAPARLIVLSVLVVCPATIQATPRAGRAAQNAQSPANRSSVDAFEVATIKPTAPDWGNGRYIRMEGAHQLVVRNHVLRTLIAAAYNLNPKTVSGGPSWVDSDHFDILAETPGDAPPAYDDQMVMLQKLLADRFALKFHREEKQFPVYALRIAKSGPKLKQSTASPDSFPQGPPPLIFHVDLPIVRLPAQYATMAELASVFQRAVLDRPVVDETGLPGRYDFDLEFTPDETEWGGILANAKNSESDKPGLYTAMQEQLGLKLEAATGPVETLIIDHIAQPSPN
jgi:uncharacterized protein (TIGR03435 family)